MPPSPSRRRRVLRSVAAGALAAVAILVGAAVAFLPSDNDIKRRVERTLSERLDADVTLDELDVSLLPRPRVEGRGLKVVQRDRRNAAPLIAIASFSARASWPQVFLRPRRVDEVQLRGLRITITPREGDSGVREKERGGCRGETPPSAAPEQPPGSRRSTSPVLIEHLDAPGTELVLLPKKEGKLPRRFSIASLGVRRITMDRPFDFDAVLTNPTPTGQIVTSGRFGPWVAGEPGRSPVEGRYRFERADLGTIKGLGGTLTSSGRFDGVLEQIGVSGSTETPDFSLDVANTPLPLHTDFRACVDGTDGDTYLEEVRARLASTPIAVKGKVEGQVGVDGRTVALDAAIENGLIEDVLRLAVKGDEPVMKGGLSVTSRILLPPGPESVSERLQLKGTFALEDARFTGREVQAKIDEFSRRGRGRPGARGVDNVPSDFVGRFTLGGGTLALQDLVFAIPGARVRLRGTYGLKNEQIAMQGSARLQAKASQMTTGFKSTLLKAADLLLSRKDAGTVLPITISGTRARPKFGVDYKGVITRKVK